MNLCCRGSVDVTSIDGVEHSFSVHRIKWEASHRMYGKQKGHYRCRYFPHTKDIPRYSVGELGSGGKFHQGRSGGGSSGGYQRDNGYNSSRHQSSGSSGGSWVSGAAMNNASAGGSNNWRSGGSSGGGGGYRSGGYNDNSRGYNDNSRGYNDNSRGYNDNSRGYNDNSRGSGYNDNSNCSRGGGGYGSQDFGGRPIRGGSNSHGANRYQPYNSNRHMGGPRPPSYYQNQRNQGNNHQGRY
ncbi:hypothetical protein M8J77_016692 [Diaphorina citri]|nr:hypothetical protein M8J77_016692 [Diaphorina citri]